MEKDTGSRPGAPLTRADATRRGGPAGRFAEATAESPEDHRRSYLPAAERKGVALCLSGGGFRATLFHLGALTRLNELGALGNVDTITSVSGGSILNGFLASRIASWPEPGQSIPNPTWQNDLVRPVLAFTATDIRTGPLLRGWRPWNLLFNRAAGVRSLMRKYERGITQMPLSAMPSRTEHIFCSTDLVFGVDFTFERQGVGSYAVGYTESPPTGWGVARAVAASSCFPPLFNPLPIRLAADSYYQHALAATHPPGWASTVSGIECSDGGVYDNLGLEPVWKSYKVLLVSDGGAPFTVSRDKGLLWRLKRYADVGNNQEGALRKRWLISELVAKSLEGAYWGIESSATHYAPGAAGYSPGFVRDRIATIRTDLDVFSEGEQAALINHGYSLAEAAIKTHLPALNATGSPFAWPYPAWAGEPAAQAALVNSAKRSLSGHEPWWTIFAKAFRG